MQWLISSSHQLQETRTIVSFRVWLNTLSTATLRVTEPDPISVRKSSPWSSHQQFSRLGKGGRVVVMRTAGEHRWESLEGWNRSPTSIPMRPEDRVGRSMTKNEWWTIRSHSNLMSGLFLMPYSLIACFIRTHGEGLVAHTTVTVVEMLRR